MFVTFLQKFWSRFPFLICIDHRVFFADSISLSFPAWTFYENSSILPSSILIQLPINVIIKCFTFWFWNVVFLLTFCPNFWVTLFNSSCRDDLSAISLILSSSLVLQQDLPKLSVGEACALVFSLYIHIQSVEAGKRRNSLKKHLCVRFHLRYF